jgi:AcrR family transcriptional regulator
VPDREPHGSAAAPGSVIWTRVDRAGRGPQPSLTHDGITTAAIEIADAEGLEALSMRKVAARLGAGTMSLYRYVQSRDDLLQLMVDRAFGGVLDVPRTGEWRADLAGLARGMRQVILRHPWLSGYPAARPAFGPNLLAVVEHVLSMVDGIGLDMDGMVDLWDTVTSFVHGYTLAELAERECQRRSGLSQEQWRGQVGPYVHEIIESGRYPLFNRLALEAEDFPDPDATFERRLGYVLDGLAAAVSAAAVPAAQH